MPLIIPTQYRRIVSSSATLSLLMHMNGSTASSANDTIYSNQQNVSFTLTGTPVSVTGKFGNALRVGNTGYVRSTQRPFANLGLKDFTFEFFVRVNSPGALGDHDSVNFDFNPIQIGLDSNRKLHFERYTHNWATLSSDVNLDISGAWTHVAVARVSGVTRMFFNGKKVGESNVLSDKDCSQLGDFIIGARANGAVRTTSGNYDIDELRMISGAGLYVNDFISPTAPFTENDSLTLGWTVAWKATSDNYNTNVFTYDIPLATVQSATEAAIAYYDSTANTFNPIEMYSFAIPADWKVKHPFTYPGNDRTVTSKQVATGMTRTSTLRYGYQTFATTLTDPWSTSTTWGRIGITETAAPFYNGFYYSGGSDNTPRSDQQYNTQSSSPTRRFVILVR